MSRIVGFHQKRRKKEHSMQTEQQVQRQNLLHLNNGMQF